MAAVEQEADLLARGGEARGRADPVEGPPLDHEIARGRGKTTFRGRTEPIGRSAQRPGHLEPVGHDDLGGGRRGGRADVSGEVGQRDIHLVAHAADHRHRVSHHGPHDPLVVEGPQVLEGASPAGDDGHGGSVVVAALLAAGRGIALHATERGHEARGGTSPCTRAATRTTRTSGHRRASTWLISRQTAPDGLVRSPRWSLGGRQRPLPGGVEQPLRSEPGLERLELEREVSEPCRLRSN